MKIFLFILVDIKGYIVENLCILNFIKQMDILMIVMKVNT